MGRQNYIRIWLNWQQNVQHIICQRQNESYDSAGGAGDLFWEIRGSALFLLQNWRKLWQQNQVLVDLTVLEEYASMLSPKTREMISKREKQSWKVLQTFYRNNSNIVLERRFICGWLKVTNILICNNSWCRHCTCCCNAKVKRTDENAFSSHIQTDC